MFKRLPIRKVLPIVFSLCFLLAGLFGFLGTPGKALAFGANSHLTWSGQQHGGRSTVYISNPTLGSNEYWARFIDMVYLGVDRSQVGIEKGSLQSPCFSSFLNYYFLDVSSGVSKCFLVNATDDNQRATLQVGFYTSNGGGTLFEIANTFSGDNQTWFDSGGTQLWDAITYTESINASFTGHKVWGVDWSDNDYQSVNTGAWVAQPGPANPCTGSGSGCTNASNPPQMYWFNAPGQTNYGGDLYSCDYSSGTTCTFGS